MLKGLFLNEAKKAKGKLEEPIEKDLEVKKDIKEKDDKKDIDKKENEKIEDKDDENMDMKDNEENKDKKKEDELDDDKADLGEDNLDDTEGNMDNKDGDMDDNKEGMDDDIEEPPAEIKENDNAKKLKLFKDFRDLLVIVEEVKMSISYLLVRNDDEAVDKKIYIALNEKIEDTHKKIKYIINDSFHKSDYKKMLTLFLYFKTSIVTISGIIEKILED